MLGSSILKSEPGFGSADTTFMHNYNDDWGLLYKPLKVPVGCATEIAKESLPV